MTLENITVRDAGKRLFTEVAKLYPASSTEYQVMTAQILWLVKTLYEAESARLRAERIAVEGMKLSDYENQLLGRC